VTVTRCTDKHRGHGPSWQIKQRSASLIPGYGAPVDRERRVSVPVWALGVALLVVGGLIGAVIVFALGPSSRSRPTASVATTASVSVAPASPLYTSSAPAHTSSAPTQRTSSASPTPVMKTTKSPPPARGRLALLGPADDPRYGQGFSDGQCANWMIGMINQSDTAIDQVTFAPPSGEYTNYSGWNGKDFPTIKAERPKPAVIDIYLASGDEQDVRFQTCTSTPPPDNPDFEFGAEGPNTVSFRWVTGQKGEACFGC
jgi:hypothetical protein